MALLVVMALPSRKPCRRCTGCWMWRRTGRHPTRPAPQIHDLLAEGITPEDSAARVARVFWLLLCNNKAHLLRMFRLRKLLLLVVRHVVVCGSVNWALDCEHLQGTEHGQG